MSLLAAILFAKTIVPTVDLPPSTVDPCAVFDRTEPHSGVPRDISTDDLVSMADIGRSDPHESPSPFGVSPNGEQIAFLVRRANSKENEYCQRLMVAPIDASTSPQEIDRGGKFIRADNPLRKFASILSGYAKVITPKWSPDGIQIAFLKRLGPTHQVWVVPADGSTKAQQVTSLPDNIDDFAWAPDGKTLVAATRPGIRQQAEAIAREAQTGFLFGDRFAPDKADRPIPSDPVVTEYFTVELADSSSRVSTSKEIGVLKPERPPGIPDLAKGFIKGPNDTTAWREPIYPKRLISQARPVMALADGRRIRCDEPICIGSRELWWSSDGRNLYARQKTGWGGSQTSLLAWKIGEPAARQVLITDDVLVGCQLIASELICAREGTDRTRRLVAINPETGGERVIYDPNPSFKNIALGAVQRFRFRNAYGLESWADLVLPPGHKAGVKHPLVVVQYFSHGFLRGGTADEFPIQLLAAKGFAVLSFARPDFEFTAETENELGKDLRVDWIDRRSVQSSLEIAVDLSIKTGAVDKDRMGISGFSDGTSTTQWALINSSLFKVAALGACCEDIYSYPLAAGPYFSNWTRGFGYRFFEPGTEEYWKPMSLTLNADRIETPILVQTGDSEYESGLDVAEAFRRRGKAFELYVLEDEPHYKYQPVHRRAIYERSTEWFQFWLMRRMNCDPTKAGQYDRWKVMKGAPPADKLRCEASSGLP